jgi:alkylated DNA repair dioxygenase AlkB
MQEYRIEHDDIFKVDYLPEFFEKEEADQLYIEIEKLFKKYNKRQAIIYADPNITYTINYKNKKYERATLDWIPILSNVRTKLQLYLKNHYDLDILLTTCVIQRYPSGKVGINSHRDKELSNNTPICGISLGQTRILEMGNYKHNILSLPLEHQSLYMIMSETNQYYTHSIKKDDSKNIRISLTFRNY